MAGFRSNRQFPRAFANSDRNVEFWLLQCPGWLLLGYLVYAQAIPAFNYQLGVSMGTQESAAVISDVGVAFWYGFALADLVAYIPLLAVGLRLHWLMHSWADVIFGAALGITVYWPIVSLAAVVTARDADGWELPSETAYWIVLPFISLWGAFALSRLILERKGDP